MVSKEVLSIVAELDVIGLICYGVNVNSSRIKDWDEEGGAMVLTQGRCETCK